MNNKLRGEAGRFVIDVCLILTRENSEISRKKWYAFLVYRRTGSNDACKYTYIKIVFLRFHRTMNTLRAREH